MKDLTNPQGQKVGTIFGGADLQTLVGPPPDPPELETEIDHLLGEPSAAGDTRSAWLD